MMSGSPFTISTGTDNSRTGSGKDRADWNGQDLFAGVSLAPSRRVPVVINAGVADLTRNAGDGPRFILSAGFGFRFLPPFF